MDKVIRNYDGKKYTYLFAGKVVRTSKREFKYACVASKGEKAWVISLGNKKESTYNSMARYYSHCSLDVVEIQG